MMHKIFILTVHLNIVQKCVRKILQFTDFIMITTYLLYLLIPNKQTKTYAQLFKHVSHHLYYYEANSFLLSPTNVHIDFESVIHYTVKHVLSTAQIKFSSRKNWWRKILSLGLTEVFISQFLKYFRRFLFLHTNEVEKCFQND